MDDSAVVRIDGVSKTFRDFWLRPVVKAVDSLSLEIRRGEVFGLLGPNGSGKSTTIRMLLGLSRPDSGKVELFGLPPRAQRRGRARATCRSRATSIHFSPPRRPFSTTRGFPASTGVRRSAAPRSLSR
jgi:ABC-type uncharacterized transport system ATPase subunit